MLTGGINTEEMLTDGISKEEMLTEGKINKERLLKNTEFSVCHTGESRYP